MTDDTLFFFFAQYLWFLYVSSYHGKSVFISGVDEVRKCIYKSEILK